MKIVSRGAFVPALLLIVAMTLSASGCGNDDAAPQGAVITVSPPDFSIASIAGDTPVNFKVTVTYSDGTPIPSAVLEISGPMAEPRVPAHYQLCYYPDGVTPVDSGFKAQTDKFGVYSFSIIVYGSGNTFSDNISIFSGTSSTTIAVSAT